MNKEPANQDAADSWTDDAGYDEKKRRLLKKIVVAGIGVPVVLKMTSMKANATSATC
jgi:hypothetical protein